MAFCVNCGQELPEGAKFCAECGTQVNGNSTAKRRAVYDGEIHKCPNCGELLKSFMTTCPTCAYELRGVTTNSPVEALTKKIEMATSLDDKIELITNFYIPNTKEDIYDFFILAVSNLEDKYYDTDDAWKAKMEQAYHKAKLSFGYAPEFDYLEKLYIRTCKDVNKREKSITAIFRRNKVASVIALLVGGGAITFAIAIIIFASVSFEENAGAAIGGLMLLLVGLNLMISPVWVLEEMKKKVDKHKQKGSTQKRRSNQTIGKDHDAFYNENYNDMVEFLRSRGFRNIVTKPERKWLIASEGAIKGISIAGNTEFSEDDEFDIDSTIIIRYHSRER